MNLKSIKLSGFKSFADPTTIQLPGALTAVVGPNGCGKSNIVDALRWVIGESSAKQLRGGQLTDVIFNGSSNLNGSSNRKPAGRASVELLFDNTEGKLGGEYSQYNEISIRRELTRDGQSQFYLNGTRCRRRDVTDLFLGTGLGPHSYAVIEQGVISKLVEGKPEDIRTYLEEAAGTSKYRERRRETENRLQHTRENLDRLTDIRLEMEKQLAHLQRQANAAERYKVLKQEQRLTKAQLQALQCRVQDIYLMEQAQLSAQHTNQLEAKIAEHRHVETEMEQHRVLQVQANENFNAVQAQYYQAGSEVARQEQQIQHIQTQTHQLAEDLQQIQSAWQEAEKHLLDDRLQVTHLSDSLTSLTSQAEQTAQQMQMTAEALEAAEKICAQAQAEWEQFQIHAHRIQRTAEVEQTRLHHLSQKIHSLVERISQLEQEHTQLDVVALPTQISALTEETQALKSCLENTQQVLSTLNQQIQQQQQYNHALQLERDQQRQTLHALQNQKASLEALQQAAMGQHDEKSKAWLTQQNWADKPRLLAGITVEKGWEIAVETVLAPYLEAVCLDNVDMFKHTLSGVAIHDLPVLLWPASTIGVAKINHLPSISSKVKSTLALSSLLDHIYIAPNAVTALQLLPSLAAHESIITPEGLWFGPSWVRVSKTKDQSGGVLQRKQALEELEETISAHQAVLEQQETAYQIGQGALSELEQERDTQQQNFRDVSLQCSESQAQLSGQTAQLVQHQKQALRISEDLQQLTQQRIAAEAELQVVQAACEEAESEKQILIQTETSLRDNKQNAEAAFQQVRHEGDMSKRGADASQLSLSTAQNQLHFLTQNIQRVEKQLAQLHERKEAILVRQAEIQMPLEDLHANLQRLLDERVTTEKNLTEEKQKLSQLEDDWRNYEKQRAEAEKSIQVMHETLAQIRIKQSAAQTNHENHLAHIIEAGYELANLLQDMPAEANETIWQQNLASIDNRIQRLGAINLAAIEEYQTISERKTYLDSQDKDLRDAMEMLETAIAKIDRESRARLRETFDKANTHFKELFNRMFVGGNAELVWVGDEVLSAGVAIRAQPPGKRNTLLHLLSGGEKALTAIALVFALFQLNPAPFCVLDEVDAPLDEANVGRFCRLVKSMSQSVQFLFISHNKSTMEMAQQMIGVTMQEPGVSRLVSVDMEQAIAMVESADQAPRMTPHPNPPPPHDPAPVFPLTIKTESTVQ